MDENNQNTQTTGTETSQEGTQPQTQQQETPAVKTFTQAEVDAMIEKRLSRERAKQIKTPPAQAIDPAQQQIQTPQVDGDIAVSEEAKAQASAIIAQANQRLIAAVAQGIAAKLGINPDYSQDVLKLADLSKVTVGDDGTIDEKSITAELDGVLKRMPMLKLQQETSGGFKVGGQGNTSGQQPNTWASSGQVSSKKWNKNKH